MTSPSYPAALDALANPGPTTETDDAGFELDIVVARLQNCVMAIEQKLGIGTGAPPGTAAVLRRSATGASQWGQAQGSDIAPLTIAGGNAGAGSNIAAASIVGGDLVADTITARELGSAAVGTSEIVAPTGVSGTGASGQVVEVRRTALDAYSTAVASGDLPGLTFSFTSTATDFVVLGLTGAHLNSTNAIQSYSLLQGATPKNSVNYQTQTGNVNQAVSVWEAFNPGAGTFTYKATYAINAGTLGAYLRFIGILFKR